MFRIDYNIKEKKYDESIVGESDCVFYNNSPENINIKNTFSNLDINGYNMFKVVGDMDMFAGGENPEAYLNNKVNFVGYATLINGAPAYFMVVDCSLEQCYFDKINDLADKSAKSFRTN